MFKVSQATVFVEEIDYNLLWSVKNMESYDKNKVLLC